MVLPGNQMYLTSPIRHTQRLTFMTSPQDRVLCVPDHQHQKASNLFTMHSDILTPFRPSPMGGESILLRSFPRFKATNSTDFWVLVTASFAHIPCDSASIERSKGGLPYPSLTVYAKSLLDTQNGVDLEDLMDGMVLSEEWGERYLDLDEEIDVEWAKNQIAVYKRAGVGALFFSSLDIEPRKRRLDWQQLSRNTEARLGFKRSRALHLTRFRRIGSQDPRSRCRNNL